MGSKNIIIIYIPSPESPTLGPWTWPHYSHHLGLRHQTSTLNLLRRFGSLMQYSSPHNSQIIPWVTLTISRVSVSVCMCQKTVTNHLWYHDTMYRPESDAFPLFFLHDISISIPSGIWCWVPLLTPLHQICDRRSTIMTFNSLYPN